MTVFTRAILRTPSSNFADGLTTAELGAPDVETALTQHREYARALERCGLALTILPPDPRFPDSCFVEDTAVLCGSTAIVTRPGAASRTGEVEEMRGRLAELFPSVRAIEPPGTLDGGDVCEADSRFFIGVSERTNEAGARQLANFLDAEGKSATLVDIRDTPGILHLKSGVTSIGDGRLVAIGALAENAAFSDFQVLTVASGEEYAANCVRVNDHVLVAAGFPRLESSLESLGYPVTTVPMSEFRKMDGGLSCLSLRF
ncbi:MAG TPA: N(G),N(G)-dimethylarginine dimethylaminohydrolase [Thermoanaerobaculia bacterium]|nr:N(G),N(G)-dimethylarginine dimethylaminohydrolase [Thermoanaerobaculia bacterium]